MSRWRVALFLVLTLFGPGAVLAFDPVMHHDWMTRLTAVLGTQTLAFIAGAALEEQHCLAKRADAARGGVRTE